MSSALVIVTAPDDWDAERMGFVREVWNAAELTGIAADCVQMTRAL
jgi:hypothetical protein